tara:strand:+ start:36908 stop:37123 length:216 start_codon:yes stop_codon:yes gene_type:complete
MYCKKELTNDKLLLSSMRIELDEYLKLFYSHWTEFELENADSKIELAKNAIERAQKHLDMAMKTLDQIELE